MRMCVFLRAFRKKKKKKNTEFILIDKGSHKSELEK